MTDFRTEQTPSFTHNNKQGGLTTALLFCFYVVTRDGLQAIV